MPLRGESSAMILNRNQRLFFCNGWDFSSGFLAAVTPEAIAGRDLAEQDILGNGSVHEAPRTVYQVPTGFVVDGSGITIAGARVVTETVAATAPSFGHEVVKPLARRPIDRHPAIFDPADGR